MPKRPDFTPPVEISADALPPAQTPDSLKTQDPALTPESPFTDPVIPAIHSRIERAFGNIPFSPSDTTDNPAPESQEDFDSDNLIKYFEAFDLDELATLSPDDPQRATKIDYFKSLWNMDSIPYFVVALFYSDPRERSQNLRKVEVLNQIIKNTCAELKDSTLSEKETYAFDQTRIFPEAKAYLENVKESGNQTAYEEQINLVCKYLVASRIIREQLPEMSGSELSLILRSLVMNKTLSVNDNGDDLIVMDDSTDRIMSNRIVLQLHGHPLILDTSDLKIKTIEECAKSEREKKQNEASASYSYRTNTDHFIASYEGSSSYPKEIAGYEKATDSPYLFEPYQSLSLLINAKALPFNASCEPAKAKAYHDLALEISPNDTFTLNNLGLLSAAMENPFSDPKEYFEKALELNPNDANAAIYLGELLFWRIKKNQSRFSSNRTGYENVKTHLTNALRLKPNIARLHSLLANAINQIETDRFGIPLAVIEHLQTALTLDPHDVEALLTYGNIFLEMSSNPELKPFPVRSNNGSHRSNNNLLTTNKLRQYSLTYFRKALTAHPNNPDLYVAIASIFLHVCYKNVFLYSYGDYPPTSFHFDNLHAALIHATEALTIDPNHAKAKGIIEKCKPLMPE
jgi:tetratricopeptide (TPR) repeat protein